MAYMDTYMCACVSVCVGECPGSCFQMTPSSELSLGICISYKQTHTPICLVVHVHASVVASFLLGWESVTSI